jgi:hypothetical protein
MFTQIRRFERLLGACNQYARIQWSLLGLSATSGISSQMMGTEMVLETSVLCRHMTRLIVREDFIEFSRRKAPNDTQGCSVLWLSRLNPSDCPRWFGSAIVCGTHLVLYWCWYWTKLGNYAGHYRHCMCHCVWVSGAWWHYSYIGYEATNVHWRAN